jgi:hypothetical protein
MDDKYDTLADDIKASMCVGTDDENEFCYLDVDKKLLAKAFRKFFGEEGV